MYDNAKYHHEYYLKHRDLFLKKASENQKKNWKHRLAYYAEYRKRPEYKIAHALIHKKWYLAKKESDPDFFRVRENYPWKVKYTREYRRRNRAWYLEQKNKRRNWESNGIGITAKDILAQLALQEGMCFYCGEDMGTKYTVDHTVPLSKGGTNSPDNFTLACKSCNSSKSNGSYDEFVERLFMK